MSLQQRADQGFRRDFGQPPTIIVRAPGRVNLIGEHTDYNDGFVLPMAIDRAIWIALQPRADGRVVAHALDLDDATTLTLETLENTGEDWAEYLKGVAWSLQEAGYALDGWEGVIIGDVPRGAGLSSSAALELATARAFSLVSGIPWDPAEMAKVCQRAENDWVGVQCGIMDQMIAAAGQPGHALLIDCRSLDTEPVPLPPETAVIVLDTATRRGLVDSIYNERREQCEAAARFFGVPALRDVSAAQFEARAHELDDTLRSRARHVVTENARTLQAAEAMRRGDRREMGRLMSASHASLRDDFAVSSRELDAMAACARRHDACYGARMTGAGFGGCAIALIRADAAQHFSSTVAACYREATGISPNIHVCQAAQGAEVVTAPDIVH
ncbi:MAG: galactokinase [Chloroflexota bacterium]|nr:galactokinase [Chloroflexota bacterium]